MKAFVSYSVSDNNEHVLTLLSLKLREKGFVVNTSQNFYQSSLDPYTMSGINDCHLFIALITIGGNENNRVLQEWRYASARNIPNILLIEEHVPLNPGFIGNYVRFNRLNPQHAIQIINQKMLTSTDSSKSNDAIPWILGGAVLLAVLSYLSSEKS